MEHAERDRALVGALLLYEGLAARVTDGLGPAGPEDRALRVVFETALAVLSREGTTEPGRVVRELERCGRLDVAGGEGAVLALAHEGGSALDDVLRSLGEFVLDVPPVEREPVVLAAAAILGATASAEDGAPGGRRGVEGSEGETK